MTLKTQAGVSFPLGATYQGKGVNFSIFSKSATGVRLFLFKEVNSRKPFAEISLDANLNRTDHYWHIFVEDLEVGTLYGYQIDGPWEPERGLRFDPSKVLLDPYAKITHFPDNYLRQVAARHGHVNTNQCIKGAVVDSRGFDWQGTHPIKRSLQDTVIYELHVAGFTKHPSSGVPEHKRGTYAGVIEKIPYLKELGVTAIELMPVQQFDLQDAPLGKNNYWGYSPINFFSPHNAYSSDKSVCGAFNEFRTMVRELHKAGIEVILDVVFNHTAEGGHDGPTLSMKGLQNDTYYMLENEKRWYSNYSGCGNTCNANHSVMRRMIRDALRFWVNEMHVDGFRFDLASVLARDSKGHVMKEPPLLWSIDSDPSLAGTKIIAEAWDAAGLYQVGEFVGDRWNEWNGKFRDDVRSFFRSDSGVVGKFASRLLGSPDIYYKDNHSPQRSVNLVTAHDGFTLNDLVSYNDKHNLENGENNRDGDNHNISYNYGVEGPTLNPKVNDLREQQMKNFFVTLLLSLGTPMITMGDEVKRTQGGNNNAYCQDNETSWFDWTLVDKNPELLRFVQELIKLRRYDDVLEEKIHLSLSDVIHDANIEWHGVKQGQPDWSENSHSVAMTMLDPYSKDRMYMVFNSYWEELEFEVPSIEGHWFMLVNTSAKSPEDVYDFKTAPMLETGSVKVAARSVMIFVANPQIEKRIEDVC
ncbi:glycogen debranching protein GlgX [Agarivorans sp. Toyoura001]|uniref:glycogen debranching protein GlgX n=1 Tax=unclassified Agarivorans TaxID=2636026 RepID=UPI0010EA4CE3|nr:glycogen debranching protein GlgX [Agarivorans sp. Toyoura001]GDY26363.1 glycogen operon protein GlgX homolog [Agarivorans sp. Toyoura001]